METQTLQNIIPAAIKTVEPAKTGLTKLVSGEVYDILHAQQDLKIKSVTDDKVKEALRYVMVLVGIRANNLPADEEKIILLMHLRKYFGFYTIAEIRLAFELAIVGELGLKPDEVKCYENFSCEYVSRIMRAYGKYAKAVTDFFCMKKEAVKPMLPPPEYKSSEMVDTFYQEYLRNEFNLKIVSSRVYDAAFESCGLTIEHDNLLKIIQEAKDHVLNEYTLRLAALNESKEARRYIELKRQNDELIKTHVGIACKNDDVNDYAKALCLQYWFCQQKNKGIKKII